MNYSTILYSLLFYIYGAISLGYIATYLLTGKKLYECGTRNVGIANSFNTGGKVAGILAVINEASKGILPIVISKYFLSASYGEMLLFTYCSIVGTIFPVFTRFRGGKGRSSFSWALFLISSYGFIISGGLWLITLMLTKNAVISYNLFLLSLIPILYFVTGKKEVLIFITFIIPILYFTNKAERDDFAYYGILTGKEN
ncbi:MAG: glycerol-3-phosphate acyltransferase [Candidatus Schekmanbacteria bacterium]|nr:MAG: glycerol-3-phosphate acyltransferase [Candidatus Schekmanbacteria bacterium]